MKKILILALCFILFAFSGCDAPSQQMAEEDIRKQIVADNASLTGADDAAGAVWLQRYLNVGNAEMVEFFRTDDMSQGFEFCFSKWSSGQSSYIVSEAIYGDGSRYLCDLYELTGVTKLHTLSYAYDRIKGDERFSRGMAGIGDNNYSEGITEVNITEQTSQTVDNSLLVEESISEQRVLYGIPSDGSTYTVRVVATVDGTGIRNVYMCNDERPATDTGGKYLLNKSYYICFSETTGDFVLLDRLYNESLLYDVVDTDDRTRRMPSLYGVWEDRIAVYTVSDNNGVVGVGIYNAETKTNTVLNTSGVPVGMSDGRLYLSNEEEDGTCTVGYINLGEPTAESVLFDGLNGVIESVSFSSDGRMAAVYAPVDGRVNVAVLDALDGSVVDEQYIEGIYCDPKYVGFLEDGSVMILCDQKLLCDEYLFLIGE